VRSAWTWPDASGPSYERRRGLDARGRGNGEGISAIWQGSVRHRRFAPRPRLFLQPLHAGAGSGRTARARAGALVCRGAGGLLSFRREDYLRGSEGPSSRRSGTRWRPWGDAEPGGRVLLLGNVRCLGFYFSPVNFYFCYPAGRPATCWRRSQYPLERAPLLPAGSGGALPHDKDFHVSPSWDWGCATTGASGRRKRRR
jgi:DUF1365 family protein